MDDATLTGDPDIPLTLRRNGRARRISLRVSRLDGRVTLTLPSHVPEPEGLAFAEAKAGWIRQHLAKLAGPVPVGPGTLLPVEGTPRRVTLQNGPVVLGSETLVGESPAALRAYLKALCRDRLAEALDTLSKKLGRTPSGIRLADPRSRWGSCNITGRLMFSWRLILAPPGVLSYVAAHEAAHLIHMDHSPAFWAQVGDIRPGYREERDWLRREGMGLHRWIFER